MLNDVGIWLYDLPKCGYFPFRGNAPPTFGGITQSFDALTGWTTGKMLGQTSTFTTSDGDEGGGAYFLQIAKSANGDFLLGLWNGLPGNKNNISSVGVGDVVGSASAQITEIDATRIPGFATYFWIMPTEHRVACIRVKHDSHGMDNFKKYMASFLRSVNPQNVVLGPEGSDREINIVGYRAHVSSPDVVSGVFPKFAVKSIPLPGDIAFLRANAGAINKVICKTTLHSTVPQDLTRWQKLSDLARYFMNPPPLREEAVVKLEFPMEFTTKQLDATIKSWSERDDSELAAGQDDLGFHMRSGETRWLGKSQPRATYQIDVSWFDDELVDMTSLLNQLQVYRTAVLALG
ncbi:hypothetical protein [Massilia scottii]|uniref:hypothetical protein n=1 Tax=Massilia scottii TaxID=3057166 RepID=UPI0027965315|nr:hypothetical protein [Massilia sp. CCM 9029]MDQ1830181.1 hypothetical protein [Massilia sp. CCM 9029]